VKKFLESPYQETRDVDIASITGVGSSALGSAALAWDISVALEKPVLAIVPGYGIADVILQGLGSGKQRCRFRFCSRPRRSEKALGFHRSLDESHDETF
jgi:hypothetical protein